MSGLDFAKLMKENNNTIPIIYHSSNEFIPKYHHLFNDSLAKPFNPDNFNEVIDKYI